MRTAARCGARAAGLTIRRTLQPSRTGAPGRPIRWPSLEELFRRSDATKDPKRRQYGFVLVDRAKEQIIGTSMVFGHRRHRSDVWLRELEPARLRWAAKLLVSRGMREAASRSRAGGAARITSTTISDR